jgi:diacylglycerol kinase (ATP)
MSQAAAPVWLIVNPTAGGGRARRRAEIVRDALVGAGLECEVRLPGSAAGTRLAVDEAVAAQTPVVVACGGDGTVHETIQSLTHGGPALGVMPGGSGDDLAAALGFRLGRPEDSARAIARAARRVVSDARTARLVDLGVVSTPDGSEQAFLGVVSTGFDSAVNERANRMRRWGGARYLAAMARELVSFRPAPYVMEIDDEAVTGRAMLVAVGNGGRYGGGMRVCPGAQPDDGLLDITWLSSVSRPTFVRSFPSVYRGTHVSNPFVATYRGRSVRIEAPGQVAYADGEPVGPLPVLIQIRAGALRILPVPPAVA